MVLPYILSLIWPHNALGIKISHWSLQYLKDGHVVYPKDDHLEYPKDVRLDFLTTTVADLRRQLARCEVSSVDLVKGYLEQIDKHNLKGMRLNAVISIAPEKDILKQARALDLERVKGKIRGPMHGIPVIIKVSAEYRRCTTPDSNPRTPSIPIQILECRQPAALSPW